MSKNQSAKLADDIGNVRAINEEDGPVVVKVQLPAELYDRYKVLADAQGLKPAELMANRLERCVEHSSIRSLYFSESQVRQLEAVLQTRPINDPAKAIANISSWFKVRLNEFEPVPITADQVKRLHLGASRGTPVQEHISRIIQAAVGKATGSYF